MSNYQTQPHGWLIALAIYWAEKVSPDELVLQLLVADLKNDSNILAEIAEKRGVSVEELLILSDDETIDRYIRDHNLPPSQAARAIRV